MTEGGGAAEDAAAGEPDDVSVPRGVWLPLATEAGCAELWAPEPLPAAAAAAAAALMPWAPGAKSARELDSGSKATLMGCVASPLYMMRPRFGATVELTWAPLGDAVGPYSGCEMVLVDTTARELSEPGRGACRLGR
jgi:hypothetical protein